jgi:diguanylate cyclase (GGDEF)-like protein
VDASSKDPDVVPLDLSFGDGAPLLPIAPAQSAARALLDRYLTPFVLDARRVLELAGRAERLAESASTDSLTGLLNRRMLDRALGRLRLEESVVIIDLDHFKQVNDHHGHAAGDDVLRSFGAVLLENVRGRDLVGRYGGEEFVLVIGPSSEPETLLQRLRERWEAARPQEVTFSAGIARFTGDGETTLRLADRALYRSKEAGRDRWGWAEEGPAPEVEQPASYVEPYLGDAVVGNRRRAVRLALDLLDRRVSEAKIVEDLLAAAQREVGERWYRNELSPADEHLASGVAGAALDALAAEMPPPIRDGLVVVSCAEGDWHSLSAQMFGESLRAHGFDVSVLGASSPRAAVVDFLTRAGGDSLAVSCSLPIFFPGVARLINAAHEIGVPVIVGGRAFGNDGRRAARLGADAWAAGASEAAEVLADWHAHRPQVESEPGLVGEAALHLFAASSSMATAALAELIASFPPVLALDSDQRAQLHEDLLFVVQFLAAARLVDDDTVFEEFLAWLDELLRSRGVRLDVLTAGLEALTPRLIAVDRDTKRLLDAAAAR